ncbi:MAG: type II secretion system F family protein [Chloroflexi bacterium]|nr:type II secretion system F family protein [Chloroflexota bacterium]
MIPLVLSIMFGTGIYLVYEGITSPRRVPGGTWWLGPLEDRLTRAGLRGTTPRDCLLLSAVSGALAGGVSQLMLNWGVVSLLAAGLGMVAPVVYLVHRHDRRRVEAQAGLVDAISQLRDAIRSGLSVSEALLGLARGGPDVLRPELTTLVREMRLMGFEQAIAAMQNRLADPVFDVVAASLTLNDRLGGRNVSQVLDRLAHATRAQLRVQDELRALQARNVLSARIVAAIPLVVLIAIRHLNPAYLEMFDDWPGQVLLAGCLVSILVGYAGMRWMTRLPSERRVLR